jgi:hypothetical protein
MNKETKLISIKILHSAVWFLMASATFYILYSGIMRTTSIWLWIAIGMLGLETIVLWANRWICPMTPMAMKYTSDRQANFDIYLPLTIAKYNKQIFGTLFVIGLVMVLINFIADFYS